MSLISQVSTVKHWKIFVLTLTRTVSLQCSSGVLPRDVKEKRLSCAINQTFSDFFCLLRKYRRNILIKEQHYLSCDERLSPGRPLAGDNALQQELLIAVKLTENSLICTWLQLCQMLPVKPVQRRSLWPSSSSLGSDSHSQGGNTVKRAVRAASSFTSPLKQLIFLTRCVSIDPC